MAEVTRSVKTHVFLSHGKQDSWIAGQMATCIQQCGATVFLDEAGIAKGDNFKKIIHSEIDRCDELVALLTPWSCERSWLWVELGAAWGKAKRIVAVLHGLTIDEVDRVNGGRAILEDINVVELNKFEDYIAELNGRIEVES